jgi:hypothetical protein
MVFASLLNALTVREKELAEELNGPRVELIPMMDAMRTLRSTIRCSAKTIAVALKELRHARRVQHPPGMQEPEFPYMQIANRYLFVGAATGVTAAAGTRMRRGARMDVSTLTSFGRLDGSELSSTNVATGMLDVWV